jgi:hypothetical protein
MIQQLIRTLWKSSLRGARDILLFESLDAWFTLAYALNTLAMHIHVIPGKYVYVLPYSLGRISDSTLGGRRCPAKNDCSTEVLLDFCTKIDIFAECPVESRTIHLCHKKFVQVLNDIHGEGVITHRHLTLTLWVPWGELNRMSRVLATSVLPALPSHEVFYCNDNWLQDYGLITSIKMLLIT